MAQGDTGRGRKPVEIADADAAARAAPGEAAARLWWRRLPLVLTSPRTVFAALREDDADDLAARQEPILAIVLLAGMAAAVLTPTWGRLLDDPSIDGLVVAVFTFVGGGAGGAVTYLLFGLALWAGVRAAGSLEPARLARHVVGFAALPIALSLFVTVPIALVGFGGDFFRSGGSDDGLGRAAVLSVGLAFAGWSTVLVALGLRVTFRLAWRGVAIALALATVVVAAVAAAPRVL